MARALAGGLALEAERRVSRVVSDGIRFERADGTSSSLGFGKRDDCYYYVPGGAGGKEE